MLLLVLLTCHLVRAVTVKITGGPAIVTIEKMDWLKTDGKEVEISVSEGTIQIISKAIVPVSIGR